MAMEPIMMTYIIPELSGNHSFLKMRAVWFYGEFGSFNFKNEDHLKKAIELIYNCLFHSDLPVRL